MLDQIAEKYGKTNVQIAIAWTTHLSNITTLVKSSKIKNLMESMHSFDFRLSDDDYNLLRNDFSPQFNVSDTVPLI